MTKREKNILFVALAVGVVFALTQGWPSARAKYSERASFIEQTRNDIEREKRLIADATQWLERRQQTELRLQSLGQDLFQGDSVPMISANIQRVVRDYANQTGISITSTKLAEAMETDGWVLVQQEITILTDNQRNTMAFLQRLEQSSPRLGVSTFAIRRNRNQYAGTLTVVGFSRTAEAPAAGAAG